MVARATSRQEAPQALQPVRQKVRVYNSGLLSDLLAEADRAHAAQAQVR